jgi:hypothetical protein
LPVAHDRSATTRQATTERGYEVAVCAALADRYQAGYLTVPPIDVARLRCDPAYGLKIFVAGIASHTR